MSTTVTEILQKFHLTLLGVPIEKDLLQAVVQRGESQGWGWLVDLINGFLSAQAAVSDATTVVQSLAKNGFGLSLSREQARVFSAAIEQGQQTYVGLLEIAILQLGGELAATLTAKEQAATRYMNAAAAQGKDGLDNGVALQTAIRSILLGINQNPKSLSNGNDALDNLLASLQAGGLSMRIMDGYVAGALVYVDENGDGVLNAGEWSGKTNASGSVLLPTSAKAGKVMASGGVDILTGKPFTGVLTAPSGSTVVSPITTMVDSLVSSGQASDVISAAAQVQRALGIPENVSALTFDPLATLASGTATDATKQIAVAMLSLQQQVATVIAQVTTVLAQDGNANDTARASASVIAALATTLVSQSNGQNKVVDLTQAQTLVSTVQKAAENTGAKLSAGDVVAVAKVVSLSNDLLDKASKETTVGNALAAMSKTAAVVQGDVIASLKEGLSSGLAAGGIASTLQQVVGGFESGAISQQIEKAAAGSVVPGINANEVPGGQTSLPGNGGSAGGGSGGGGNSNASPTGGVTISGTPRQYETLTAVTSTVADADGLGAFSYKWLADGVIISGATASTLSLSNQSLVNKAISVVVSYTDQKGTVELLGSAPTSAVENVNDLPVGSVIIKGAARISKTLYAFLEGSDADGLPTELSFSWWSGGNLIEGETRNQFTLTSSQLVGKPITAVLNYTDLLGTQESLRSAPTNTVIESNTPPTGTVSITGIAAQNQILSANNDLNDADGLGVLQYQWFAGTGDDRAKYTAIAGANSATFALTQDQVGKQVYLKVSYKDLYDYFETQDSPFTPVVQNVNDTPTGSVIVQGNPQEDVTLTATTTSIADLDGLGVFSYQWLADGTPIAGATASTFKPGDAQVGKKLTVEVRYTDRFDQAEILTSAQTLAIKNLNDAPSGSVSISGPAREDQTLRANATINDDDGLGTFSYQWLADGVEIPSATAETLALTNQSLVGKKISVVVRYKDMAGTDEAVTSPQTVAVENVADMPKGSVTITGQAVVGNTLTAQNTLEDDDGIPQTGAGIISYQWYAGNELIQGAISSTYTLTNKELNKTVSVRASYTDLTGATHVVPSGATQLVTAVNTPVSGTVTIDGVARQGETLTAADTLSDANGLGPFTYQWYRDVNTKITGATSSRLTLTEDLVGAPVYVEISFTDNAGFSEKATSAKTASVLNVNDLPTGSVTISGTPRQYETLTAVTSTVSDADGLGAFSYQWRADGVNISGETSSSLRLSNQSLVGKKISVVVSYTDAKNTRETLSSAETAAVTNVNDLPTGEVTISRGIPEVGSSLTADPSTIKDLDGLGSFSYQWFADGVAINGATRTTLPLTTSEKGKAISVRVSYVDGGNTSESKTSELSALVGTSGADIYLIEKNAGTSSVDRVSNFGADDVLLLSLKSFGLGIPASMTSGQAISAASFVNIEGSKNSESRFIYRQDGTDRSLYFDADGSGSASTEVKLVTLTGNTVLEAADIYL